MDVVAVGVGRRRPSIGCVRHGQAMAGRVVRVVLGRDRTVAVALLLLDQLIADTLVGEGSRLG